MARTPTVYRWDDPGAPDLSALHTSNNERDLMYFHTVLKACLVTGYGAKAAAGWTMPHEETTPDGKGNRFVLTNAANSGSLLYEGGTFSGGGGYNADTLWACSAVPDMDAPVSAWSWNVKYADRNTASGNVFHKSGLYFKYGADSWVVIANENTFIVVTGRSVYADSTSSGRVDNYYSVALCVGAMHDGIGGVAAPASGNFYVAGGGASSYSSYSYSDGYISKNTITTIQDVLGIAKSSPHTYSSYEVAGLAVDRLDYIYTPHSMHFTQKGGSSPVGSSVLHYAVRLPSYRYLECDFTDTDALNAFMVKNSFKYGTPSIFQGVETVFFKGYIKPVVLIFVLDPIEWGA